MTTRCRRLLAWLMALALTLGMALAEETLPVEEMTLPEDEIAPEEAFVEELAEFDLPLDDEPAEDEIIPDVELDADDDAAVLAPAELAEDADPDAMVLAPSQPVLTASAITLGVKEKSKLTIASGAAPESIGAVFTTSNKKVATVNASGLVTGKKAGKATITLDVGGVQSSCEVTVKKAPKKVTLSSKKLTLGVDERAALTATLPKNTASAITFTSSKTSVATVDASGRVTAMGVGKATITAKTFNGKKAKCTVTVKPAPMYVTANIGETALWVGRSVKIKPVLSAGSAGKVSIVSSNPSVVQISGTTAKALAKGSATITLTAYNGLTAEIPVTVTKVPIYRALVIGEGSFPGSGMSSLPGSKDALLMTKMLNNVRGPAGSKWSVTHATDQTAEQIHQMIRNTFAGAEVGDVSLFYISTHGDQDYDINGRYASYAGCLLVYPDYRYYNWYDRYTMTLSHLANWLCEVPGQVIVMIDSCGSGAAIYGAAGVSAPALSGDQGGANVIDAPAFSPEAFDQAVVDAFRDVDKGVLAPGQGVFVLENKFFVLTASAYRETSWSLKNKYSYFTKWLTDGIKTKGKMPADSNKNKYTTLNELYGYMKKKANGKTFRYRGASHKQHVQVYPANSGFELFYRK